MSFPSPPHALSVWRRNLALYRRTWRLNILPNFFEPVFYLWALGIGLGSYISGMAGLSYVAFLAPALVCVSAMNGASYEGTYNAYVRLNFEKAYAAMLTTPVQPEDVLAGEVLWAMTRASIYGGCFLVAVVALGYVPLSAVPGALLVIPLTGLLFAAIAYAFTLAVPSIEFVSFFFTLFLTPLFLFSDVFFPLAERLSGGWLWVAEVLPLLHPVRMMRGLATGQAGWAMAWDALYIVAVSGVLLWVAARVTRRRLEN